MTIKIGKIEIGVLLTIKTILELSRKVNIKIYNQNSIDRQSKLVKLPEKPI